VGWGWVVAAEGVIYVRGYQQVFGVGRCGSEYAAGPAGETPAFRPRCARYTFGTLTLNDCGTIVIVRGVFIVTTSPSMPRWR
jgi:hypothetical protein